VQHNEAKEDVKAVANNLSILHGRVKKELEKVSNGCAQRRLQLTLQPTALLLLLLLLLQDPHLLLAHEAAAALPRHTSVTHHRRCDYRITADQ
jgi:hypothetical protein